MASKGHKEDAKQKSRDYETLNRSAPRGISGEIHYETTARGAVQMRQTYGRSNVARSRETYGRSDVARSQTGHNRRPDSTSEHRKARVRNVTCEV